MSLFHDLIHFRFPAAPAPPGKYSGTSAPEVCFSLSAAAVSDRGRCRPVNEDSYLLDSRRNPAAAYRSCHTLSGTSGSWHLAGVFDGMGGGDGGALASGAAADALLRIFPRLTSREVADSLLRSAFLEANNEILRLRRQINILGTTGTVLCTDCRAFKIYHLGDSRACLLRDGSLFPLTRDQTLARLKADQGLYDPAAPEAEADRHKLTDFIGHDTTGEGLRPVESHWIDLLPGDEILLCSDGLYNLCSQEQILSLLQTGGSVSRRCAALVQAAASNGGTDNITCLLIHFHQK